MNNSDKDAFSALLALLEALGGLFTPLGQVIDIEEDDDEDEEGE